MFIFFYLHSYSKNIYQFVPKHTLIVADNNRFFLNVGQSAHAITIHNKSFKVKMLKQFQRYIRVNMYRNLLTHGTSNSKQKSIINMIILYYSSSDWSRKLYDMAKKRHVSEGLDRIFYIFGKPYFSFKCYEKIRDEHTP